MASQKKLQAARQILTDVEVLNSAICKDREQASVGCFKRGDFGYQVLDESKKGTPEYERYLALTHLHIACARGMFFDAIARTRFTWQEVEEARASLARIQAEYAKLRSH